MAGKPEGYVEVNVRIQKFYTKYPEGSLRSACTPFTVEVDGKSFVVYGACTYRTPDDLATAEGWAWEPVPGPTSFTKGSELMNAETSAWGRAIAALGFEVKEGIASANEVRARQGVQSAQATAETRAPKVAATPAPVAATSSNFNQPPSVAKPATPKQRQDVETLIDRLLKETGQTKPQLRVRIRKETGSSFTDMTSAVADLLIPKLEMWLGEPSAQESLGGGVK